MLFSYHFRVSLEKLFRKKSPTNDRKPRLKLDRNTCEFQGFLIAFHTEINKEKMRFKKKCFNVNDRLLMQALMIVISSCGRRREGF